MTKRLTVLALLCSAILPAFNGQGAAASTPTVAEIVAARVARFTRLLTLTTAQANQATSFFTTEETALATIRTNAAAANTALTSAIEANSTSGISASATTLGNLQTQEVLAQATADAAFYAMLTTAQQTIEKELLAAGLDQDGPDYGRRGGHR